MVIPIANNEHDPAKKTLLNQYSNHQKTKELTNDQALSGCAQS